MTSIRNKIFLQVGLLITTMILLMIIANSLLAEPYYLYRQRQQMMDYFQTINALSDQDYDDTDIFSQIETEGTMDLFLENADGEDIYVSLNFQNDLRVQKQMPGAPPTAAPPALETISVDNVDGNLQFTQVLESNFNIENLILTGTLDNGLILEMRISLQYMRASIEVINQILLLIGLVFILISMAIAYMLSISFTKPILAINTAAERMQGLNFDTHCDVTTKDELGQLSANINHMSDALSDTIDTLHVRDEKRRALLNNVSHELKTPLTLMQGYAVALKNNVLKNPEKTDFYAEVIIDETEKMSLLVETLLDIDQLELDKKKMTLRTFEVNAFVKEVFRKFEHLMEADGLDHHLTPCSDIDVVCDPILMERVLKNLLSNAIRYMGEEKKLHISIAPYKSSVRIEIMNSAEHVEDEELEKLWESFYKMDKARTRDHGGHGLGLSIVKAIQQAHHQPYGAKNMTEGICFWFEIAKA